MSPKQLVSDNLAQLPEDCTFADALEKIRFLAAVQEGFVQHDQGLGIPHGKVKERFAAWLSD